MNILTEIIEFIVIFLIVLLVIITATTVAVQIFIIAKDIKDALKRHKKKKGRLK